MPDPNDPFDFIIDQETQEQDLRYGVASSTSQGTPMAMSHLWGSEQPGQAPDLGMQPDPWMDWMWQFDQPFSYVDPTPVGGFSGGGGPMEQVDMLGGGGTYASDALYDQTGNPTGSQGYEEGYVDPGTSQSYWDDPEGTGENTNTVNSLIGGGMDTESGQYGWYGNWGGSPGGFDEQWWIDHGIDPSLWGSQGSAPGDFTWSQNPAATCAGIGGYWYNNFCNEYDAGDAAGWSFTDEAFGAYAEGYGTSGASMDWFGQMVQDQYNSGVNLNDSTFVDQLSGILMGGYANQGSIDLVMETLEAGMGTTINWEQFFSSSSQSGGINFQQVHDALGTFSGGSDLCASFGSALPWC